jgi:hypothetical protein
VSQKRSAQSDQVQRFREAARELGADVPEERLNAALRKVATAPPSRDKKAKSDSRK